MERWVARNANVRVLGSHQKDAIRNLNGVFSGVLTSHVHNAEGLIRNAKGEWWATVGWSDTPVRSIHNAVSAIYAEDIFTFDASRVVPTGGDNRPSNTALIPRQKR